MPWPWHMLLYMLYICKEQWSAWQWHRTAPRDWEVPGAVRAGDSATVVWCCQWSIKWPCCCRHSQERGSQALSSGGSEGTCHWFIHRSSPMLLGQWEQQVRRRRLPRASSNGNDCCHGNSSYVVEEETGTSCGWVIGFFPDFQPEFEGQKGRCPSASSATPVALPTDCRYLYTTLSTGHFHSPLDPELPCTIFTHLTKFLLAFCRCEIKRITKVPPQL